MNPPTPFATLAAALTVTIASALAFPAAALGVRFGLWHYKAGFLIMTVAWFASIAGALLCAYALFRVSGARFALAVVGLAVALAFVAAPWGVVRKARRLPAINDITTDTMDPPPFRALLAARAGAETDPAYQGGTVVQMQRVAYPLVRTHLSAESPAAAYARALAAARALGWRVVAEDPASGSFEATDTSFWFGFVDDVAVRVLSAPEGSKVDVRSHSRVGRSDLGANARRVLKFLDKLSEK